MVVADRQSFQLRQAADLPRKFAQLIRVQHKNAQVDEVADFSRYSVQMEVDARLPFRTQI